MTAARVGVLVGGKTGRRRRHQWGMGTKMTDPSHRTLPCGGSGPPVDVVVWRRCRLLEAGFRADLAEGVAADRTIDVHALLDLVDRGCPPELAVRILSPTGPTP